MSETTIRDARNIRKHIREAESLSDELMMACARLKQAMLIARQNPQVTKAEGQSVLMRLSETEQQALSISSNLFRMHGELNRISNTYLGGDDGENTNLAPMARLADQPESNVVNG